MNEKMGRGGICFYGDNNSLKETLPGEGTEASI